MPVLPQLQAVLDAVNEAPTADDGAAVPVDEARRTSDAIMTASISSMFNAAEPVADEHDHEVPVDGGSIIVRVYTPDIAQPAPCHVYFHGGGFWMGNLEHTDPLCRAVAVDAECIVASVAYRLAPEHPFPAAPNDCYTALTWLVTNAQELGIDAERLSVGGGSAGGNLAAVVALMARDRGGPNLTLQVLDVPVTDLTMSQPSVVENGEGLLLTRADMERYRAHYLRDAADATNPYASPLLAVDLRGLPPALIMTAEFDPLRDEGEAYAERLRQAGVPVELHRFDGHIHGSIALAGLVPESAAKYHQLVVTAIQRANRA